MLKHNLLIFLRTVKRESNLFFINLIGLSAGLTCTLLIYLWVNDELVMDQFNSNEVRVFQVMEYQQYSDNIMTTTSTPGLLSQTLKEEIPEVALAATVTWVNPFTVSVGETNISAKGLEVGQDYFQIFSFPLIKGNAADVLKDYSSIVISDVLAKKLFGEETDILGKQVILQHTDVYQISGVFKVVENSSSQFDFVTSYEARLEKQSWLKDWGSNGPSTYVLLQAGSDAAQVSEKIKDFVKKRKEDSHVTLFLQRYADRYLYGKFENGKQAGGRIEYIKLFSIVAVAILLIACVNFMNLTTAQATRRAKEVGVKKSVGAERNSIMSQFLTESMVIAIMSLVISLFVVWLFLPTFNLITDKHITLQFNNLRFIAGLSAITITAGLLAGSYPAIFLSGFKPVDVLKGERRGSLAEVWIRKGLVIFQFAISVILIASVLVIYKQIQFTQDKSLGYNKDNLIRIRIVGKLREAREAFINEVKNIPGVVHASSIGHNMVGRNNNTMGVEWKGKLPEERILFETFWFDYETAEVLALDVVEGRSFSREFINDTSSVIFNEAGIRAMNLENPIGQLVKINGSGPLTIVGVVKDFHFQSLHSVVNPAYMRFNDQNLWNIIIRLEPERISESLKKIEGVYTAINPGFSFDYAFQNEEYEKMYSAEQRVASLANYFSLFAILISCLGLYGLASHTADRKLKEMGIRKALGSSSANIVMLLSYEFIRLVLTGICIGLPISYWWLNDWLQRFAFHVDLTIWYFAIAAMIAVVIAWITIASKAWQAARVNPVDCIRLER
jgi:putative ABC transport system permease protein